MVATVDGIKITKEAQKAADHYGVDPMDVNASGPQVSLSDVLGHVDKSRSAKSVISPPISETSQAGSGFPSPAPPPSSSETVKVEVLEKEKVPVTYKGEPGLTPDMAADPGVKMIFHRRLEARMPMQVALNGKHEKVVAQWSRGWLLLDLKKPVAKAIYEVLKSSGSWGIEYAERDSRSVSPELASRAERFKKLANMDVAEMRSMISPEELEKYDLNQDCEDKYMLARILEDLERV